MASDDVPTGPLNVGRVSPDRARPSPSDDVPVQFDQPVASATVDPSRLKDPAGANLPPAPASFKSAGYGGGVQSDGYGPPLANEVHLRDYLRVIYKHRRIAVMTFMLTVLATAVVTFTATSIYEATAQILIENEDPNVVSFEQVLEQSQRTNDYYQTQYRILRSRALARRTLDTLKLWEHPQFRPSNESGRVSALVEGTWSAVAGWAGGLFGSAPAEAPEPPTPNETAVQSSTIDRFLAGITVAPVLNSRLVDLRYRSPDPGLAANVANTLARGYIDSNLEYKLLSSKEATEWLAQQLQEQRKEVEATERALQDYRERNDAVSLEDRQNIVVQKFADLNAAVTRARTERIQKEAAYNQIKAIESNRAALDTLPAVVSNSFIQDQKAQLAGLQRQQSQMNEKLGPKHPEMLNIGRTIDAAQARIEAEIAKIIESLRNDYQQALAQERSLGEALNQQTREISELNRKGIGYSVLSRDAAANRQLFESVLQRMKETGVSSELRTNNVRVVDAAEVPRSAASPRKRRNMLLSFPVGLLLAAGVAFFFEYLDNRLKRPEEIPQHLGLPFLGMVPALGRKAPASRLINNGVPPTFVESFRALRTSLIFSSADQGCRSLVVTSTAPAEGKTLVASNVALSFALAGETVLLIDADLRKPRVHEVFGMGQKPGLSNVLVGTARASDAVQKTTVPGLWILPAGECPPNAAELLGSKRCRDFLTSLSDHFAWIIIDTPPVMAATDAVVVANRVSGVLFVVGAEMTPRSAAQRAIGQLEQAKAKFAGAVLNRVDLEHNPYYYSDYYRREYSDYYAKSN